MRIAYLLDRPELGGGVKVVFQHASLLADRGHRVWVAARGPRPDWAAGVLADAVDYRDVSAHPPDRLPPLDLGTDGESRGEADPPLDLVLATYWTTLAPARQATRPDAAGRVAARAAAHLLQGYEPDWPHQSHRGAEIEAAYRAAALPALVVASHLGESLAERHGLPWRRVPPPVDPSFRPARGWRWHRRPGEPPWIVLPGIFEAEVKGVRTGLAAVRRMRQGGLDVRLLRVSVLPQSAEERELLAADRYLTGVSPERVAAELRRADLLLFPARSGEGFGLPLLEAMASGVPAVASRLPSTVEMAEGAADLVPLQGREAAAGGGGGETGDAGPRGDQVRVAETEAFAEAASALLSDPPAWRKARRAGLAAAERFAPARVADDLEAAVAWAVARDADAVATNPARPSP